MKNLTCPIPDNINPLQSNGFMFTINKLPSISFFCQEANLPGLDLPKADFTSPLVNSGNPGDKLFFADLNITFLVDEKMTNYKAIAEWMMALGFPQSYDQYTSFIADRTDALNTNEARAAVSDGVLQIMDSSNNVVQTITFIDMFPTSLSSLQLQTTSGDTNYLAGQASFVYTLYKFT